MTVSKAFNQPLSLYVHWPFCLKKCPYCDFNSHVRTDIDSDSYLEALLKDLSFDAKLTNGVILTSIFFGGGTPSLMPAYIVEKIIDKARLLFNFSNSIEITLEANPTSVEAGKFKDFKSAGINRLSLGIQSLNDEDLKKLGRDHTASEALGALEVAKKNFSNCSFDIIYARNGQTLKSWKPELEQISPYISNHVSMYQLTIEKGTKFMTLKRDGSLILPTDEESSNMYIYTNEHLAGIGLHNYEVSNYALSGYECVHNLNYWNCGDYIAIGAGAKGRLTKDGKRLALGRQRLPEVWLKGSPNNFDEWEVLSQSQQIEEAILMGLRLSAGLNESKIFELSGLGFKDILDLQKLEICLKEKLLTHKNGILKTTLKGRLNLNSVSEYILKM